MLNFPGWFCYYVFKLKTGMLFLRHKHWDFMEAYCAIINYVFAYSFFLHLARMLFLSTFILTICTMMKLNKFQASSYGVYLVSAVLEIQNF